MLPDLVQFSEELVVFFNMAELSLTVAILLERPVGRRSHNEVHAPARHESQIA